MHDATCMETQTSKVLFITGQLDNNSFHYDMSGIGMVHNIPCACINARPTSRKDCIPLMHSLFMAGGGLGRM